MKRKNKRVAGWIPRNQTQRELSMQGIPRGSACVYGSGWEPNWAGGQVELCSLTAASPAPWKPLSQSGLSEASEQSWTGQRTSSVLANRTLRKQKPWLVSVGWFPQCKHHTIPKFMNVVSLNKELEMCKSQASRARRSWLQLTTDQDDQAFSCPHPSVNECGREHGLGQGSPLQLIQSLKGLTTEGSLLTPLPAAGAMSPFLMGSLGHPSQSPPYCFEKLSHLLLN